MADNAIMAALDRLQHSLERLDGAVEAALAAPSGADSRDDRLRDEVRAVIGELDRMIGGRRG